MLLICPLLVSGKRLNISIKRADTGKKERKRKKVKTIFGPESSLISKKTRFVRMHSILSPVISHVFFRIFFSEKKYGDGCLFFFFFIHVGLGRFSLEYSNFYLSKYEKKTHFLGSVKRDPRQNLLITQQWRQKSTHSAIS